VATSEHKFNGLKYFLRGFLFNPLKHKYIGKHVMHSDAKKQWESSPYLYSPEKLAQALGLANVHFLWSFIVARAPHTFFGTREV
jgi:hypothetical protein